jgi:hypothetical protein
LAAGINRDTDRGRKPAGDTSFLCSVRSQFCFILISRNSYLQLSEGETASSSYTTVVLDCWASDNGSQLVDWAGRDSCCFRETGIATSELAAGLYLVLDSVPLVFSV